MPPPRVLSIAGSDPSGGAGLQADLKTFHAQHCYGMAVVTALTAQNTCGVSAVHVPPAEFIDAQIRAIVEDCPPRASKTGMLFSADLVDVVGGWAARGALGRLVVDPVMVATSGDRLLRPDAEQALLARLCPAAELLTPNIAEAGVLTGRRIASVSDAVDAAHSLADATGVSVLLKGGDRSGAGPLVDVLARPGVVDVRRYEHDRHAIGATHGTGCTLSAAIAARFSHGDDLEDAVARAIQFVQTGLRLAFPVGRGAVPVNHLVAGEPELLQ